MASDSLRSAAIAEPANDPPRKSIEFNDPIPYGVSPIDYHTTAETTAVSRLQQQWEDGARPPLTAGPRGYLDGLLQALQIPVSSQVLVFSKTALNPQLVSPKRPRAIYFNENVAVGWVPEADAVEVMAIDPVKGFVFYTLRQPTVNATDQGDSAGRNLTAPKFRRENRCLACHAGTSSLQIPGGLMRSFVTNSQGRPLRGYSQTHDRMEFSKRFGGWYVTGKHGDAPHLGNLFGPAFEKSRANPLLRGNLDSLSSLVDLSAYPQGHSDVQALLVLMHQVHGWNLLIRVGQEARLGLRSDAEDRLLRYLLFANAAPLPKHVQGFSSFQRDFSASPRLRSGAKSLRQFSRQGRLFNLRLSYLIYSEAFAGLPVRVKGRLLRTIQQGLQTDPPQAPFDHLQSSERRAILEVLSADPPS